jgi:hypothetical protein
MNNNIDLNIDNYSIGELKSFFKLPKNYTNSELIKKVSEMETVVSSSDESEYKYETLYFITQAKQILTKDEDPEEIEEPVQYNPYNSNSQNSKLYNINENKNITQIPLKNPPRNWNSNVGKILNPGSNHQSMETTYIENDSPLKYNRFIKNYVLNTLYRDNYFGTSSNNCTFTFPTTIKNVISMSLSALQYQNVMFTISNSNHTDQIYIREDTTKNKGVVIMPEGSYSYLEFPTILANAINQQILGPSETPRFSVSINPNTHYTTISNSTYTFSMEIITYYSKKIGINCNKNDYENDFTFSIGSNDAKNDFEPEEFFNSLGYIMGYRKLGYMNKMSYTSESVYQSERYKYIYFAVNDYVGNQTKNTVAIFPELMLDEDILALIPISSEQFTTTFTDGSTYIYRTRNYNGPVDISKISIQLINPMGQLANIHDTDFAFCLQIETIADMTKKFIYKPGQI